jgi:hypothetical protein
MKNEEDARWRLGFWSFLLCGASGQDEGLD